MTQFSWGVSDPHRSSGTNAMPSIRFVEKTIAYGSRSAFPNEIWAGHKMAEIMGIPVTVPERSPYGG